MEGSMRTAAEYRAKAAEQRSEAAQSDDREDAAHHRRMAAAYDERAVRAEFIGPMKPPREVIA
jgi:hypothetical protein